MLQLCMPNILEAIPRVQPGTSKRRHPPVAKRSGYVYGQRSAAQRWEYRYPGTGNVGGLRLVVKRYNIKNAWHALKRCFRPSRAWKSWRNAHRLASLGIPTPRPIALVENRWGPLRSKAYFITEYIEAINLNHLLRPGNVEENNLKDLIEQFVAMLQLFADASLSHGDFKATNFLVDAGQISITDLDAMREHRFRWLHRRAFRKDCKRLMKNWKGLPEIEKKFQERLQNLVV